MSTSHYEAKQDPESKRVGRLRGFVGRGWGGRAGKGRGVEGVGVVGVPGAGGGFVFWFGCVLFWGAAFGGGVGGVSGVTCAGAPISEGG